MVQSIMNKSVRVEISSKTIVFTVLFLISLFFLWQIKAILGLLVICFILSEAINSSVSKLQNKFSFSRTLSIALVYLMILFSIIILLYSIVPVLVEQTTGLINILPSSLDDIKIFGTSAIDISSQFKIIENLPNNIAKTALGFVSNIFSAVLVLFITFYLLLERPSLSTYAHSLFGQKGKKTTEKILDQLQNRLGHWVNAQLFLMFIVGLLSYFGYLLLGLRYAVPLALLAGFLEMVPNLGPTIAAILAGLVGLTVSPLTALLAVIWGILVQQLENNFIVPKIMKKSVGLNPIVTIFLLIIGSKLGGIIGAVIALPIFLAIQVIGKIYLDTKK